MLDHKYSSFSRINPNREEKRVICGACTRVCLVQRRVFSSRVGEGIGHARVQLREKRTLLDEQPARRRGHATRFSTSREERRRRRRKKADSSVSLALPVLIVSSLEDEDSTQTIL